MNLLFIPFFLQGGAMFFDEFYFHRKRGLGLWERRGHPLDTLTVIFCYLFLLLFKYSDTNIAIYLGLAIFSCLFVTKDEFIHARECSPGEHWLHSFLFILHPIILASAGLIWFHNIGNNFIFIQFCFCVLFFLYQVVYWSFRYE
jgi:hypothetical protein